MRSQTRKATANESPQIKSRSRDCLLNKPHYPLDRHQGPPKSDSTHNNDSIQVSIPKWRQKARRGWGRGGESHSVSEGLPNFIRADTLLQCHSITASLSLLLSDRSGDDEFSKHDKYFGKAPPLPPPAVSAGNTGGGGWTRKIDSGAPGKLACLRSRVGWMERLPTGVRMRWVRVRDKQRLWSFEYFRCSIVYITLTYLCMLIVCVQLYYRIPKI